MADKAKHLLSDSLIAQLLEMGFDQESIRACENALTSSGSPITLQSATDWILQRHMPQTGSQTQAGPTLRLGGGGNAQDKQSGATTDATGGGGVSSISRPMSSGSALDYSVPLRSRYDLSDEKRKKKEEFLMKERDDALKKARERKVDEMRAKAIVLQQIEEDKQRRANKALGSSRSSTTPTTPVSSIPLTAPSPTAAATGSGQQCRVQVRLPNGSVLRHTFPSESTLSDVTKFIADTHPSLTNIQLVQPFPHKEFTVEEHSQSLLSLGLCPSASLVISKKPTQALLNPPADVEMPESVDPGKEGDQNDDDDDDDDDDDMEEGENPHILPHPHPGGIPGRLPPHPFPGGRGLPFPPLQPGRGMVFEGEGHRLGGSEAPMRFGDPQAMSKHVTDTARLAAEKRAQTIAKMAPVNKSRASHVIPSLEMLCIKVLEKWSSVDLLPNCSHVPPRTAQRLLAALAKAKQLHPKTLNMFLKCPIQSLVLDNYCYATNQLLDMVKYFPSLTHLSLVSCNLITDKSLMQLLPYLPNLSFLNLNECQQISDESFQNFKSFSSITVLRLAFLKLTDTGLMYLFRSPLPSLQELDVSYTLVSSKGIARLRQQAPGLRILNIESTTVSDLSPLSSLEQLHALNLSRCPIEGNVGPLAHSNALSSLNLSHIPVDCQQLKLLAGLKLTSFVLPERSEFFDQHMLTISSFPLTSLDLTGYRNITDYGVRCLSQMKSLSQLFLGRTRLTDEGMSYIIELTNLRQLSLDNTNITDNGMMCISGLVDLEDLSLSDTRLTSQFILDGAVARLHRLQKLNLVRTSVDDKGLLRLSLPSLIMLNIDWTCATEGMTIELLRDNGCPRLETLRNSNIGQLLPSEAAQVPPPPQQDYDDLESDDEDR